MHGLPRLPEVSVVICIINSACDSILLLQRWPLCRRRSARPKQARASSYGGERLIAQQGRLALLFFTLWEQTGKRVMAG